MNRSRVIALGAAALSAPALRVAAQGLEPVRFGVVPVEEAGMAMYAKEKGFFQKAGIDAQITVLPNGGSVTQALLGGALDCGVTNSGSMSSAHSRGVPLYLIACGATYSPGAPIAHLALGKTTGVKTAKDLAGKTLAVSTLRDMIQATVLGWIEKNGGDYKAVNFVEMPPPQMPAAIVAKRIDGGAIVEPIFTSAKNDVIDLGLPYSAANDGKPFQTLGVAANKDWADKNAATAKKVAAAIHEAAKWANMPKNRAECVTILAQYSKIEPAVIASYPRVAFAEANSAALVQPVIDLMSKYGFLPKPFPAAELFAPGLA